MAYIYITTNLINGNRYIGKSILASNKYPGKSYLGGGILLKAAIKKYGRKNFKKEILVEGNFNNVLLNQLEKHYIRLYATAHRKNDYNISRGGEYDNQYVKEYSIDKSKKRLIYQYNKKGQLLNIYKGTRNAALNNNVDVRALANSVKTEHSCNKLYYTDDKNKVRSRRNKKRKNKVKLYVYSEGGKYIKALPSIKEGSKIMNIELEKFRNAIRCRTIVNGYFIMKSKKFHPKRFRSNCKPFCIFNDKNCYIFYTVAEFIGFVNKNYSKNYKNIRLTLDTACGISKSLNFNFKKLWE